LPWFPPFRLVVIDPLSAYFPAVNTHDNVQVRRLLQPLVELAAKYHTAIVGVTHLNKSIGQPGQYRAMGSLAFTAVARAAWGVARDPADPDRRLLLPIKNNLGPTPTGLAFRIVDEKVQWETTAPASSWVSVSEPGGRERTNCWRERAEAFDWLIERLSPGEQLVREIQKDARDAGISEITLRRARLDMKARLSRRMTPAGIRHFWALPDGPRPTLAKREQVAPFAGKSNPEPAERQSFAADSQVSNQGDQVGEQPG
jgi:hypothetical protein